MFTNKLISNAWDRDGQTLLEALQSGIDLESLIMALTGIDADDERFSWQDGRALLSMIRNCAAVLENHSIRTRFIALAIGVAQISPTSVGKVYNLTSEEVTAIYRRLNGKPTMTTSSVQDWDRVGWVPSSAAMFDEQVRVAYARLSLLTLRALSPERIDAEPDWLDYIEAGASGSIKQARRVPSIQFGGAAETAWLIGASEADSPVIAWSPSPTGPKLITGVHQIDGQVSGVGVVLSWADAGVFDEYGPLAGIIALGDQHFEEIELRIWAALWACAAQPMVIIVTHPTHNGPMSEFSLDEHLPKLPVLTSEEYFPSLSQSMPPDPFLATQEIWHIRPGLLTAALRFLRMGRRPPVNPSLGVLAIRTPRILRSGQISWEAISRQKEENSK
jgi:hypothetical protein